MERNLWRIVLSVFCFMTLVPWAFAADIQTAKVYRDYPGYFTPPTCENPLFSADKATSGSTLTQIWNCPNAWTFTPMLGYHVIDGGLDIDNNVSLGLAVGYNLTANWTIEADVRYTPTQTDYAHGGNEDINIWAITGGVLYHFMPEQRMNPYMAIGAGGLVYDIDNTSHDDEDYMGFWGGGIKYAINNTTAFRVDLRHILDYRSSNDFETQDGPDWRHQLSAMAGVTFQFGR